MSKVELRYGLESVVKGSYDYDVVQNGEWDFASGEHDTTKLVWDKFLDNRERRFEAARDFIFRILPASLEQDIDVLVPVPEGGRLWAEALQTAWRDTTYGAGRDVEVVPTRKLPDKSFELLAPIPTDDREKKKIAIVDDVLNTGFSTLKTIDLLPEDSEVTACLYLSDRSVNRPYLPKELGYHAASRFIMKEEQ